MPQRDPARAGDVPTATRPELLVDGSDEQLRKLVYDLFTVAERLTTVRRYMGQRLGITGPQFHLLTAIKRIQREQGATVGDVAAYLRITPPFVVAESRKLEHAGLLEKRSDERDGRITRLRLSPAGEQALLEVLPELQRVNDLFFDVRDADEFAGVCATIDRFVAGSAEAMGYVHGATQAAKLRSKDAQGDPVAQR